MGKVFFRPGRHLPGRTALLGNGAGGKARNYPGRIYKKGVDYKPGSVTLQGSMVISLAGSPDRRALVRPTWVKGRAILTVSSTVPFLALHRMGFAKPFSRLNAGGLLPRHFTLTVPERGKAVSFLLHFPWDCSQSPLETILPFDARTFLGIIIPRPCVYPFFAAASFASLSASLFPSLGIYFIATSRKRSHQTERFFEVRFQPFVLDAVFSKDLICHELGIGVDD